MRAGPENDYLYNPLLKERARELRRSMTNAEVCLWKHALRAGRMKAYGFHRQRPVMHYIADFFCSELMLIVEVDGAAHHSAEAQSNDALRTAALEGVGFRVLRFTNEEVLKHLVHVQAVLEEFVDAMESEQGDRSRLAWKERR